MGNRSRTIAIVMSVAMFVGVGAVVTSAGPVGAAVQPFSLAMTEGTLRVRAAEDALALESPTTITGQHDTGDGGTGAVTGGDLSTPTIGFQTVAAGLDVFVDASFSSVAPGNGTGSIDADGNVSFRTDVRVDLDLRIGNPTASPIPCTTAPVSLGLESSTPWDPGTRLVTVADANFTIPPADDTAECTGIIRDELNEALAGAGNSLTMTLQGDLTLPPAPGCPTLTELVEVDPASSFQGDEVTLAATVEPDPAGTGTPECEDAVGVDPTGTVEFRVGGDVVALADLDGTGRAEILTTSLPVGDLDITARYRGNPPYSASTSSSTDAEVAARPSVVADVPPSFQIDGPAEEFDVTVTNSALGADLANARLDLALRAPGGGAVTSANVEIERFDGTNWVPAPLHDASQTTALMALTGVPLPPGGEVTQRVRLRAHDIQPAVVAMELRVVEVDPGTGQPAPSAVVTTVGQTEVRTAFVRDARQPADMTLSSVTAHTLRQGMVVTAAVVIPGTPTLPATGTLRAYLDGQAMPIRANSTPVAAGYLPSVPVDSLAMQVEFALPPDTATGAREVVVEYSGDRFYDSDNVTGTFTVLAKRGAVYECGVAGLLGDRHRINVSVAGILPDAVKPGVATTVRQLDVRVFADRGDGVASFGGFFPPSNPVLPSGSPDDGFTALSFGFGDLGTGTGTEVTFANNVLMDDSTRPVDPDPDQVIGFIGETASITLEGAPGQVVPVELSTLAMKARLFGGFIEFDVQCTPVGDPASLGDVTVAGTTLTVDGPEPTREGDAVTLRAAVAPAGVPGTVEFRDGTDLIGVAPVASDGTASLATRSLEVGMRSLTATFRGGTFTLVSDPPVVLEVRPTHECPTFTAEGNGRTVRLVYLTLLRRCPDQAGYAYWTGRLDGGTSRQAFAS
ncbi:MAG TPA: Ig-like domain repeat protein, partial [Iamia sp.]|nr:Ig-like domain repeat protein [Iamia sp.]